MPDDSQPNVSEDPNATPNESDPSQTPPSSTVQTPPALTAETVNDYRYTAADAPYEWAIGKTVKETMDLSQEAFTALQTKPLNPSTGAQPAPQPQTAEGVPNFDLNG